MPQSAPGNGDSVKSHKSELQAGRRRVLITLRRSSADV